MTSLSLALSRSSPWLCLSVPVVSCCLWLASSYILVYVKRLCLPVGSIAALYLRFCYSISVLSVRMIRLIQNGFASVETILSSSFTNIVTEGIYKDIQCQLKRSKTMNIVVLVSLHIYATHFHTSPLKRQWMWGWLATWNLLEGVY